MFHVDIPGEARLEIRRLFRQASQEDRGDEFLTALQDLVSRLEQDPISQGEPLYALKLLRLTVYAAVKGPVGVVYGVLHDHPIVIIRNVYLMSRG
jgi:hypothetical protein